MATALLQPPVSLAPTGRIRGPHSSKVVEERSPSHSSERNRAEGKSAEQNGAERSNHLRTIVEGCQQGDRDAQFQLFELFQVRVFQVAARMVGRNDAADVTQQVFLQVFRSIAKFAGRAQVGTWIHRIAVNESLQHLRRRKAARTTSLQREPIDRTVPLAERIQQRELWKRAVESLPDELRVVLLLRETEDLSYAAISEMLCLSEGTVASRINRARSELKRHLTKLGWEF